MASSTSVDQIQPDLGEVQETLLIPLYYRACETLREDAIIRDEDAVRIIDGIDYDFSCFDEAKYVYLDCVIRSEIFDERVERFISNNPNGAILNLGAGLDARFQRVDNGSIRWFDLDFPDVIGIRDQLLPASDRVTHVASSAFDSDWLDALAVSRETPVMVIAEGLFCYCEESQVRELFLQLSKRFQDAHVLFQSISPRYVGRESQVGAVNKTRAKLRWGVRSGRELLAWKKGWEFVGEWAFIDRHRSRWGRLRWLSLLPWVGRDLREVLKVTELRLSHSCAREVDVAQGKNWGLS
jgi:O-methyltransferase involved in polyketide biosynthesis